MNRICTFFALLLMMPVALFSQNSTNRIHDPYFKCGFSVVSPDAPADSIYSQLLVDSTATPVWTLRQYNSRFDIANNEYENIANRYVFKVPGNGNLLAKSLTVNPAKGMLTLECNASAEYTGLRRSHQPWVYMTIDAPTDTIALSACKSLKLSLSYKLLSYEDCMGFLADKSFHGATYRVALKLLNVNRESMSFGKSFRLVLVLFDNRYVGYPCLARYTEVKSPLGGDFAFYPATNTYLPSATNGHLPKIRQSVELNAELIPIIEKAIASSVSNDLLSDTQINDWEIVACDLGWEMTGTYNAVMQVRSLQLVAQ